MREGEATLLNAVAILGDSIRAQLETEEVALITVSDRLRGLDWDNVTKPEISDFLVRLKASLHQVSAIMVADRDGIIRASSRIEDLGRRIAEQKFFGIDGHDHMYVSATFSGQSPQPISLAVIRRRTASDGRFDGTIHAELDYGYLDRLSTEAVPIAHDFFLVEGDGEVVGVLSQQRGLWQLDAGDQLMRHIISQPLRGLFSDGYHSGGSNEQLLSYEHVPGYPVWVGVAVDQAALLSRWYGGLKAYAAAAAAGSLALVIASWLAIQRARAEQEASTQLQAETQRRLVAEQRTRKAQRLEAVGQLASGIAHDFNNLLTVIMGSLDMIRRTEGLSERIQRRVSVALDATERGARLTLSLLAFAQRQALETETLNVDLLISEFVPVIEQSLGKTIGLELRLDSALHQCQVDAAQLEAALLNVAINARDAMPEGGTLTIATRRAELDRSLLVDNDEAEPGSFIAVSLADTGSGMSQQVVARAVEPFFTTKGVGKGSGLGLSQVLGFVRQLGGHLTIESEPGRGSVVTLFLPRALARCVTQAGCQR